MVRGLFYILVVFVVFFLVKRVIAWVMAPPLSEGGRKSGTMKDGEMVKDPVCATYIPVDRAVRREIGDKTHYFCSEDCAGKFMRDHVPNLP